MILAVVAQAGGEIEPKEWRHACQGGSCAAPVCSSESSNSEHPAGPWPLPCSLQPHLGFPPVSSFNTRPFVVGSFLKWFDVQGFDPDEVKLRLRALHPELPSPPLWWPAMETTEAHADYLTCMQIANCSVQCLFLHLPSGANQECVEMADLVLLTVSDVTCSECAKRESLR